MGIQGVTRDYKGLQGLTKGYKNLFFARTSLDTLSWFNLHKNQSLRTFQLVTKTID